MTSADSTTVLGWLKAAGEDSRLRLLALCARQELSVSDLAEALRQSEPRVSRHLKILCDAGLLERMRQGQWVHYRVTQDAAAAAFVQGLLAQMDRNDPLFVRDRDRVAARAGGAGAAAGGAGRTVESRLGRALKGFVAAVDVAVGEAAREGGRGGGGAGVRGLGEGGRGGAVEVNAGLGHGGGAVGVGAGLGRGGAGAADVGGRGGGGNAGLGAGDGGRAGGGGAVGAGGVVAADERQGVALVVGVEHLELLEAAAEVAGRCVAIAHSRRAAQSARTFVERRGLACRVLLAKSSDALCEKDIEAAGAPFDVVFLDHVALATSALDGMLSYGRRALAANGRLWVFERYESLEGSKGKVVEHPIGRLRRLLGDVGLSCERLSPIETDGEHVIAAVAVPARGASRGTGAAGAA